MQDKRTWGIMAALAISGCATGPPPRTEPHRIAIAGIIEGFYGTPWSHADRLDLIAFLDGVGLTDYVYAPKDDPYHLRRWREPYPDPEWERLGELAAAATAHGVRLWYAISPGLSIQYSSDDDYAALLRKLDRVATLGIDHFGLFLDDVSADLVVEEDRARFGTLASAHIAFANRLASDLRSRDARLMFTPTTYTNAWGDREYARQIGAGIDPDVPIIWTGMDVASPVITRAHAETWATLIGRRPLLWDNYPVNDYAPWRLFLGPVTGRSADLPDALVGLVANPMNQAHASMLALHTLATYVADPHAYDPASAHTVAVAALFGPAAEHVQPLLEVFGDHGWDDHVLEPLFFQRDTIDLRPITRALAAAQTALDSLRTATDRFIGAFVNEVEPILAGLRDTVAARRHDPRYRPEGERLIYDSNHDRYVAAARTPIIDGRLDDWTDVPAHPMTGAVEATVRFARDSTRLYVGITVIGGRATVRAGAHLPEGDHVMVLQQRRPADVLTADDRLILAAAPSADTEHGETQVRSLTIDGFMAKWLQDNARLTFNAFHMTNMATAHPDSAGVEVASRPRPDGYAVEIALPIEQALPRLAVVVSDRGTGTRRVASLARRNYPINPRTFVRIR